MLQQMRTIGPVLLAVLLAFLVGFLFLACGKPMIDPSRPVEECDRQTIPSCVDSAYWESELAIRVCVEVNGEIATMRYETYEVLTVVFECAEVSDCVDAYNELRCYLCGECWGLR
jgi:hypothetical protein